MLAIKNQHLVSVTFENLMAFFDLNINSADAWIEFQGFWNSLTPADRNEVLALTANSL